MPTLNTPVNADTALTQYIEFANMQYQMEAPFLKMLNQEADETEVNALGRKIVFDLDPNASFGFNAPSGGNFPTPGTGRMNKAVVGYVAMQQGIIEELESILNADANSITNPLKLSIRNSAKQAAVLLDYYFTNSNGTTRVGTSSASVASGSVIQLNGAADTLGARSPIVVGMRLHAWNSTGTVRRTAGNNNALTVVSKTNTSITVDAAAPTDIVSGDILCPADSDSTVGFNGLPTLIADTGNLFGLSRTSEPNLKSTVMASGGTLTTLGLLNFYKTVADRGGMDDSENLARLTLCFPMSQEVAYHELTKNSPNVQQYVHSGDGRPAMDVGFASMKQTWFGAPIKAFRHINGDRLYALDFKSKSLKLAILKQFGQVSNLPAGGWLNSINGAGGYKQSRQRYNDFIGDFYLTAPFLHGVYTGLGVTGFASPVGVK